MSQDVPQIPCFFDGACPRNQFGTKGPMKAAYVIGDVEVVREVPDLDMPAGAVRSNNVAEYKALIFLLRNLLAREATKGIRGRYLICGDSQLVVRQMDSEYRVTKPHLQRLHAEARKLCLGLDVEFRWVPRGKNRAGLLLEDRNRTAEKATREN